MTTFEVIATILIAVTLAALIRMAVKLIDVEQELTDAENDADTYAKELASVKTEKERLAERFEDFYLAATNETDVKEYSIYRRIYSYEECAFVVARCMDSRPEDHIPIKVFTYNPHDTDGQELAELEAKDLLDALNGRVGWRGKKIQGNP